MRTGLPLGLTGTVPSRRRGNSVWGFLALPRTWRWGPWDGRATARVKRGEGTLRRVTARQAQALSLAQDKMETAGLLGVHPDQISGGNATRAADWDESATQLFRNFTCIGVARWLRLTRWS